MKDFFILITALNGVLVVLFVLYGPAVFQNLVFTFKYLTTSDVDYYDPSLTGTLGTVYSDRFGFEFWVYASDLFRFGVPILYQFLLNDSILYNNKPIRSIVLFIMIFMSILELVKLIWRSYVWGFCPHFQFCRSFDPAECTGNTGATCHPNFIWLWTWSLTLIHLVIYALMTALLPFFETSADAFYDNLKRRGVDLEMLEYDPKKHKKDIGRLLPGWKVIQRGLKSLTRAQRFGYFGLPQ